jgi:hypothetical protein
MYSALLFVQDRRGAQVMSVEKEAEILDISALPSRSEYIEALADGLFAFLLFSKHISGSGHICPVFWLV